MHTIAFENLAGLSAVYRAIECSESVAFQDDDGGWYLSVPDDRAEDADAFYASPPPPGPKPSSKLSFLEFMDLFTEAEQMAIAGAAMTDVATKLWYDRAVGAQFIDTGDERLAAGLEKMVGAGLLTKTRRSRVLKGLPPA